MIDVKRIARDLKEKDFRRSEEDAYLKRKFQDSAIIRDIYKEYQLFRASVVQAIEKLDTKDSDTEIITIDEREEFSIKEGCFNLEELLVEVVDEVEKEQWVIVNTLPEIRWSNKPLRSRYGLCNMNEDGSCVISINKLLFSEQVNRETVKYLIYHELLHACGYWHHDEEFRKLEWKYPNADEHDGFLDELFQRYKIDEIVPPRRRAGI